MFLNATKIRVGLMGVGAIAMVMYLLAGGRLGPGNRGIVQIEFSLYPETEGMQVAVDGRVAGVLKSHGATKRSAFAIEEGRHEITLVSTEFDCELQTVHVESGRTVMLVVDVGGGVSADGSSRPQILFQ